MAETRQENGLVLDAPTQNPAPFIPVGQTESDKIRYYADQILAIFIANLPSNYVSQTNGPYYIAQFQAAAEQLAKIQVSCLDAYEDSDFDFTRPEVLFQFLGNLVFPSGNIPVIDGDITYRDFLRKMVELLLTGSKLETLVSGLELLGDANVQIIDTSPYITDPNSAWGLLDRFTFEINVFKYNRTSPQTDTHYHTVQVNVSGSGTTVTTSTGTAHTHTITGFQVDGTYQDPVAQTGYHTHDLLSAFPDLPFTLESNAKLVLKALKPAHTLYDYRNLFRDFLGTIFTGTWSSSLTDYHYDDIRKYWRGTQRILGYDGISLDPFLFQDWHLDLSSVRAGSILTITSGPNVGKYTVQEILTIPVPNDPVARSYVTSPMALTGRATVVNGDIIDSSQTWIGVTEGETITFSSGPNAGTYRIKTLLGSEGGPAGFAPGPCTGARLAPDILRIKPRMLTSGATGQTYSISLDNLGQKIPNFVYDEDVSTQFYGSSGTRDTFLTAFGPLVKPWGDMTPATIQDVQVLLDGIPTVVTGVNPYTGEVTVSPPISLFAPGAHTVTVSYVWFPAPVFGFTGLNRLGLVLNSWSLRCGRHSTSPLVGDPLGVAHTARFQMGIVLGTPIRQTPIQFGHRFLGFERNYTTSINRPLSLKLNCSPTRVSVPYAEASTGEETFSYSAEDPATVGWTLVGDATGSQVLTAEYELHDSTTTEPAYWTREITLPIGTKVYVAARLQVTQSNPTGAYTGVGLGFHDNNRVYLAGALRINSLRHVGLMVRPGDPALVSSWSIGPRANGTIVGNNQVEVLVADLPVPFPDRIKFQVLAGSQTGVYTVSYGSLSEDKTKLTIVTTTPFPADYRLYGNRDIILYFDVEWDNFATWRLIADTSTGTLEVKFSGEPSGSFTVTSGVPTLVPPAFLGLPLGQTGVAFWGSFGRSQTNTSLWTFYRYLSSQEKIITRGETIQVSLSGPPEDDPDNWYPTTFHGFTQVVGGQDQIRTVQVRPFEYVHIEPNLNSRWYVSAETKLSGLRSSFGGGGLTFTLGDTRRLFRLGALTYQVDGLGYKHLIQPKYGSLDGEGTYTSQGWLARDIPSTFNPVTPGIVQGDTYQTLSRTGDESWLAYYRLLAINPSRLLEARLAFESYSLDSGGRCGFSLGCGIKANDFMPRSIYLDFLGSPSRIALRTALTSAPFLTAPLSWDDGVARVYTLEASSELDSLKLSVDGTAVGSVVLSALPVTSSISALEGIIHAQSLVDGGSFQVRLFGLSLLEQIPGTLHRTFGIWLGGDPTDIDQWAITRLDITGSPNSDPASIILDMDWASQCWVRLSVDPTWGVVFERPDLPLPPWYMDDFATQSINPSAGWITVEYRNLPRDTNTYGTVSFGCVNRTNSIQTWKDTKYRIFTNTSLNYLAPQWMVLNRANVINSGELLKDVTPEIVAISSISSYEVSLRAAHITAARVFYVKVDSTYLASDSFTFDPDTQIITLTSPLPTTNYPVTVTFAPGKPVTNSYLEVQPVENSQTLLYETTPCFPEGQEMTPLVSSTQSGDGGPTPSPIFGDPAYILNDPYRVRQFSDDPNALYETLQFLTVDNEGTSGLIFPLTDETGCMGSAGGGGSGSTSGGSSGGSGPVAIDISGRLFEERIVPGVPNPYSKRGLFLSGGYFLDGLLGPGTLPTSGAVLNGYHPASWEVFWNIQLGSSPGSVLTDAILPYVDTPLTESWTTITSDQYRASNGPAPVSPSVMGLPKGTAWTSQQADPTYSRWSPQGYTGSSAKNSVLCGSSPSQPTGFPVGGTGMILMGGSPLPPVPAPVVTIL